MRYLEEGPQDPGKESEEKKKKKKKKNKMTSKDEETGEDAGDAPESLREGLGDVAEVGLGQISKKNDVNRRKKKKRKREVEVTEGNEGVSGEVEVGIDTVGIGTAGTSDEMEEKTGKKKSKDREKAAKQVGLEKLDVQHADMGSLKQNNEKRKERDRRSREAESSSEQHTVKEEIDQQRSIPKDERIADECGSDGSHGLKKRKKNLEGEKSSASGESEKRRQAKDKVIGDVKSIINYTSDRGFDTIDKPARTAEETVGDGDSDHKMQPFPVSRNKRKARKKKENKDGTAENVKFSVEGNSNEEIAGETKQAVDARKISNVSVGKRTYIVKKVDNTNASTTAETKKKVKRVSFSGSVEVFPSTNRAKSNDQSSDDGLILGKRFSQEEDEMIRQAVFDYIKENQLGENGLNMVLNCRSYPEARNCWKEIGAALPWRPKQSIYCRTRNLFQRSETRKWEPEELDLVRRYHNEHGPKWKELAELLGKHRVHVKDAWRRIKLTTANKGRWSQEEYQALFDLVNADLQLKAFEEKKTKHGMLRENISWGAISKRLSTRAEVPCCVKWYQQLTSPMVSQGLWSDADDYLLIDGLLKLDACCIEDVDWDNLLENRSGEICLQRWRQMAKHIGGHREKSFMEQVDVLATRYCPNILPYRTGDITKSYENINETESCD